MERFFQGDLHVVAKIGTTRRRVDAALAPPAGELAEHFVEDIGEAAKAEVAGAASAATVLEGGMAIAIVRRALVRIFQDIVGFVDLFEFMLGRRVAGIAIGVVLHGQLAIGPLEGLAIGVPRALQKLVVIDLVHVSAKLVLRVRIGLR